MNQGHCKLRRRGPWVRKSSRYPGRRALSVSRRAGLRRKTVSLPFSGGMRLTGEHPRGNVLQPAGAAGAREEGGGKTSKTGFISRETSVEVWDCGKFSLEN